ncbi:transposase [Streptomyces sp. NPDC055749]
MPRWVKAAEGSDLPPLRGFARNFRRDFDAIIARLTLPYSSGMVEGHVSRVKTVSYVGLAR